jgi:O-antigen/teichoic acid export membrane protein
LISDIKRLVKHTSVYTIGNLFMRVGAFVLLPLYTHYLTVAEFGILSLLSSISAIVSSFLSIGIAHATLRFYFEFDDIKERSAVVSTALTSTTVICLLAIIGLSFFSAFISNLVFQSDNYVLAINITYISLIFEMARQVGLSYMRAKEYSVLFVIVSIVQLLIQVVGSVFLVLVLKMGVVGVVIGNTLSVLAGMIICSVIVIKECGIRYDFEKMKIMLNYSYPFLFSSVVGVVLGNADRFILTSLFSLEAVGIYSLGLKFSSLMSELVIEPFQKGFGAFRFSIMKQDNSKDIQARTLSYLFFIVSWAGLGLSLFAPNAVQLLTTPDYFVVIKYIPLLVLGTIIGSTGYVFQTGILYEKNTMKLFYINLITGVFGVLASYVFIYFGGIFGACFATICKAFLVIFLTYKVSQKLYPVVYDFKNIFLCLCVVSSLYILAGFLTTSFISLNLFFKVLLAGSFPIILYNIGFLTSDEKKYVYALMKRDRSQSVIQ